MPVVYFSYLIKLKHKNSMLLAQERYIYPDFLPISGWFTDSRKKTQVTFYFKG